MAAPKILFFFPENPFSNRAGNTARAKSNLQLFRKLGYAIDLVGIDDMYKVMGDSTAFDHNIINSLFLLSRRPVKNMRSLEYWKYKFSRSTSKHRSNPLLTDHIKEGFKKIVEATKYDFIIINYEFWAGLIDITFSYQPVKILETHDWITLNEYYKNPLIKIGERFEEELNNLRKFDRIITISTDENFVFKSFFGDKVVNIPPSFPAQFSSVSQKKYDLIFVGSDNIFNIKSMKWFFAKVYPLLPETISILIIGRICRHLEERKGLKLVEFSENLDDFYDESKIAICPMLEGTGIKIKVVEALSYGLPVVGTIRAIDGFSSRYENGCLVDNDPIIFKKKITSLLQDESFYKTTKNHAEEFFKNNFSEEEALQKWKKILV
ncbi:glycosyltransferase [Chryseobacterium wangxinyae]|uniref:glycosyltransferase n=1 Tax=Chryseobacterium sp. CY353 TaxID=2997334 RepID=UPI00226EF789|nr:glycosyltransferase [Chryseobacterium sp. CY353]MCY0970371.1 glycosyltransferase [Chryseobacterium sp. CY353]